MSRSIQLVLLCVVTLSYIQLGRSDCDVQGLSEAVRQVLLPIMKDIKDDLNSVKGELTSLNESMNKMHKKMEEHEKHMEGNFSHLLNKSYGYVISPPIYTCNGTEGWRREVYLDMTNPNTNCPRGWNMTDYSKRTCGRNSYRRRTCNSVIFSVKGGEYSQVCGRIRAYQWGLGLAFGGYHHGQTTVDDAYFDGVAVLHGSPRQHIWSFVAGALENYTVFNDRMYICPCDIHHNVSIPPFVGEDYFCESGYIFPGHFNNTEINVLHSNDPLWDGKDCHSSSTCCSRRNPPYFTKTLNTTTTDDIELRMCNYENDGDTAVELVELYVK